ncbi:PREDICTED: uncharacterized protein LOC106741554 [Dinoponera quadriceps]|uniref:Uncharacterized protein LOC106741554 n=1 Tax=Dinoponera quadriceps TaxID=609295 RepID=A0A6P3WSY2_DINQU|nr:PREDICTED: uncharacterized protein LOC106741554 [Dinoponera quadriceps]
MNFWERQLHNLVTYSTPDTYNRWFNPNICHVCKSPSTNLLSCDLCGMISYCSEEHKEINRPQHTEICSIMVSILNEESQRKSCQFILKAWIHSRIEFIRSINRQLKRKAEQYEMEMVIFARSCVICHRQTDLHACLTCFSANYCTEHEEDFKRHHSATCRKILLGLNLDINFPQGFLHPIILNMFPDERRPVTDMLTFVRELIHVQPNVTGNIEPVWHWSALDYFYSDYASDPLTLYFGLRGADLSHFPNITTSAFVVHITAAYSMHKDCLPAWELFIHFSPHIKNLKVILIGQELQTEYNVINLCEICTRKGKSFSFECHSTLYHIYVSDVAYPRPNVIIWFQANLTLKKECVELISKLWGQGCPLLLTTKSQFTAEQNINEIQQVLERQSNKNNDVAYWERELRIANRLLKPDTYNDSFNPNICHVCKFPNNLISCGQCGMISYCSENHKELHKKQHMEICTIMANILKEESQRKTRQFNLKDWIISRFELIRLINLQLTREMKKYEKLIVMFAKTCVICHQQTDLHTCLTCYCANYCTNHEEDFKRRHTFICKKMLLSLNISINFPKAFQPFINLIKYPNKAEPITDMMAFVKKYLRVRYTGVDDIENRWQMSAVDYLASDYVTDPLTLYYGLQNTNLLHQPLIKTSVFVIHVLIMNYITINYLTAWEYLLHLLPHINHLIIVLIGSEMQNLERFDINLSLNMDFNNMGMPLSQTILEFRDKNCPFLLTSHSHLIAVQNIDKIQRVLAADVYIGCISTNICHICKVPSNMISRDEYGIISYFSEKCEFDKPKHIEICSVIVNMFKEESQNKA